MQRSRDYFQLAGTQGIISPLCELNKPTFSAGYSVQDESAVSTPADCQ